MKKNRRVLLLIILIFIFWPFFSSDPRVANDFHLTSAETAIDQIGFPQMWTAGSTVDLGERTLNIGWAWPIDFVYGLFSKMGLNFTLLTRLFWLAPMLILGVWGIDRLLKHYKLGKWGRFIGTLFYLLNTYLLLIIDGGQFRIGLAYVWLPVAYLVIIKSLRGSIRKKILTGLAVSLLGFFDVRFLYILTILLFLKFIFDLISTKINQWPGLFIQWLKNGLVVGFVFIGLNAYWILPLLLTKASILPPTYTRSSQVSFLSFAELKHAIFLLQPHWYKNVFGKITLLRPEFIIIPLLVFLAPILVHKNKAKKAKTEVWFWLLVAIISVFLVKGINPPFVSVYPWLFANIPGFFIFRDPTKFFFLTTLSYSVLIGISTDELIKRFNWKLNIGKWKLIIIPFFLVSYFLFLINPVWLGKMTGTFSDPVYQDEYLQLNNIVRNDEEFGRVFWIPSKAPLGYSSSTHPSAGASRMITQRSLAIGAVGLYERYNFLREAPFMGELFDIAAIKYIAYPYPDTRREELKQDNIDYYYAFLDQLTNLPWVDSRISEPPVPVLKTKKSQDHFFIAPNTYFVVGSDRIYWDLMKIKDFSLSKNAFIFAEEQSGLGNNLADTEQVKILLYDKQALDLTVTLIDKENFIFPAKNLDFSPNESGWWKREAADLIWWRDFLQQKYGIDNLDFDYGGGWAVAEGDSQWLMVNGQWLSDKILLARVMVSSRGGKIEFYQGDEKIGEINSLIKEPEKVEVQLTGYKEIPDQIFGYDKADFSWHEVGILTINNQPLTIKTEGEINVVNALAVVDLGEWGSVNERVEELVDKGKVIVWDKLSDQQKMELFVAETDPEISYQRLSPTHYKVTVEGVERNVTLAFSETYDPLWELDGEAGYPLYSLINGFTIEKDGEYDIYFSAQKYVLPGLLISGATLVGLISSLIIFSRKKK